jgi:hypothetical protein
MLDYYLGRNDFGFCRDTVNHGDIKYKFTFIDAIGKIAIRMSHVRDPRLNSGCF